MKKYIFSAFVLATSLVACTGDYTDWAAPQHNDQPATVTFGNGSVTEVDVIDFAAFTEGQTDVKVCQLVAPTSSSENYSTTSYTLNLGDKQYPLTADGTMTIDELKAYIESVYGKAPEQRDMQATVSQWISDGKTSIKTATSATFLIKAKLTAPHISDSYYIIGTPQDWKNTADKAVSIKFTHSVANVYDDPVFTVTFAAPVNETGDRIDCWFSILAGDDVEKFTANDWTVLYGNTVSNGSEELSGKLQTRAEFGGENNMKMPATDGAKFYTVTINMLDGTYTITPIAFQPYIYYVGTANGWDNSAAGVSQKLVLSDAETGTYSGYIYCKEESYGTTFKFLKEYGNWDTCYGNSDVTTYDGPMEAGTSDNNFNATAGSGLYKVDFSVINKTFKATKIEYMGVTGDFCGWNEGVEMTWNAANFCYEATAAVTAAGWKFRANGLTDPNWTINFGGDLDNLTVGGSNISTVGNTIKLYPCRTTSNNIYATVE